MEKRKEVYVSWLDGNSSIPPSKFETRKEFLEHLYNMMVTSFETTENTFGETRGRPRLLKTFIMESNQGLLEQTDGFGVVIHKTKTALPEIDIITLEHNGSTCKVLCRYLQ